MKTHPLNSSERTSAYVGPGERTPPGWYAVAHAQQVSSTRPLEVLRFGRRWVLWRNTEGEVLASHAECPHRGANLAAGRVVSGELQCRYHGFRFGTDGACTSVPCQDPSRPIPSKLKLRQVPCVQAHGFVWMSPDSRSPKTPVPWLPGATLPSKTSVETEMVWNARLGRCVEANLDLHHFSFAHEPWIRNYERLDTLDVEVDDSCIQVRARLTHQRRPKKELRVSAGVAFPASLRVTLGESIGIAVVLCPLDDEHTWIGVRMDQKQVTWPVLGRLWSRMMMAFEMRFIQPDDERLTAGALPRSAEPGQMHHVAADRGIAEWYRWRRATLSSALTTHGSGSTTTAG